ncbi:hypothetical protein RA307_09200 [Xanthobacteraceae bacterium Astr-EGSB]|uniref:hypothetical protein n=1 Tax=Astrobacterium formosum TaxID=3069710 RepID=UPI0027B06F01|nr:hypothetical protein [Xanthobacteraceae bacterium Astr-EGSB]
MTELDFSTPRYSPAELMRLADIERAKYLKALFKKLFARLSGRTTAVTPHFGGAKA